MVCSWPSGCGPQNPSGSWSETQCGSPASVLLGWTQELHFAQLPGVLLVWFGKQKQTEVVAAGRHVRSDLCRARGARESGWE